MKKIRIILIIIFIVVAATAGFAYISNNRPDKNSSQIVKNDKNDSSSYNPPKPDKESPKVSNDSSIITLKNEADKKLIAQANGVKPEEIIRISGTNSYKINITKSEIVIPAEITEAVSKQDNVIYRAMATPNDPLFQYQWHLNKISAPLAWDISKSSSSVKVAVIDSGFALDHQDLTNKFDKANAYDFINNDSVPMAGDSGAYVYHGTMVAGLVGASTDNGTGVASVGWNASVLPIQALNDAGEGNTFTIASAINYAVSKGVKVINLSLGSFSADPIMEAAINSATSSGVVVVAASGNSGCDCIIYPANYPNVIAVGATDSNDNRASFSNYGNNLDIVAPGTGSIRTTFMSASNKTSLYTTSANGTSIATPIVSGAIALIIDKKPELTPTQVEALLRNGADKVPAMAGQNFSKEYGYGRLNAKNSLGNFYSWQFVSQTGNTYLTQTQKSTWTVSARNTGTATWSNSGSNPVRLAPSRSNDRNSAFCTSTWITCARVANLNEASVPPGSVGTFTFEVQAPANAGSYNEYFNLLAEGNTWMNDPGLFFGTTVVNGNFSSSLVSSSFPSSLASGATASGTITLKNTGNTYWYNTGKYPIRIGTYSPTDRASQFNPGNWLGSSRPAQLTESVVAPGQNGTFAFQVKAPSSNGTYQENYSLLAEGYRWFDQSIPTTITVTGGSSPVTPPASGFTGSMPAGQRLAAGQSLSSGDGKYRLVMQGDGNLVIYSPNRAIWSTNTQGRSIGFFVLQGDGNMVIYGSNSVPFWASWTQNRGGNALYMQGDGNLVLYDPQFRPIWNSGTAGRV
jgi:subtilisin family serine protease